MDWIKQIPDEELIDVSDGVLAGTAGAVREFRNARLTAQADNAS